MLSRKKQRPSTAKQTVDLQCPSEHRSDLQSTCVFFKIIHENQAQHRILLKSLCRGNTDVTGSRYSDATLSYESSHAAMLFFCLGFFVVNVASGLPLAILGVCRYLFFLSLDCKI